MFVEDNQEGKCGHEDKDKLQCVDDGIETFSD